MRRASVALGDLPTARFALLPFQILGLPFVDDCSDLAHRPRSGGTKGGEARGPQALRRSAKENRRRHPLVGLAGHLVLGGILDGVFDLTDLAPSSPLPRERVARSAG